jgi:hypothetical protein
MILQSVKASGKNLVATVQDGGFSADIQLPGNLPGVQDYINFIGTAFSNQKSAKIASSLSALVGVNLTDPVAVFAALQVGVSPATPPPVIAHPAAPVVPKNVG